MRAKNNTDLRTRGCLLRGVNFVSESEASSFDDGELAWKAGTLPTELLPQNRHQKARVCAKSVIYISAFARMKLPSRSTLMSVNFLVSR